MRNSCANWLPLIALLPSMGAWAVVETLTNDMSAYLGVFSGMLLISWLAYVLTDSNVVTRVLNLLSGIVGLAYLATGDLLLLSLILLSLIAEFVYRKAKLKSNAGVVAQLFWPLVFVATSALVISLNWMWPLAILPLVGKYILTVVMLVWVNQAGESSSASPAPAKPMRTSQAKLMADRAIFIDTYKNWLSLSPSRVIVLMKLHGIAEINNALGRDFGDLLIAQMASKINAILNQQDVMTMKVGEENSYLCHLSGVDFMFAVDTDKEHHLHQRLIHLIHELANKPVHVGNAEADVVLSVAFVRDEKRFDAEQLIQNCYVALTQATSNLWCVEYDATMAENRARSQQLMHDLQQIDLGKEFQVYFHPVVNVKSSDIEFVELLLRWYHPKFGTLDAGSFINELQASGLALKVAHWVVERAAELALALKLEDIKVPISVNVFGSELMQEEFVEAVAQIKESHRLSANELIIECPASVFMELDDYGESMLRRLREHNISVCLDDLGSAPILLSQLPRMPLGYVKIDRIIVQELSENVNTRSLLGGIIDMSTNLNMKVICAGIETEVQYTYVASMKCYAVQGYLFSRPISSRGLISWLKQWQKKLADGERPY